MKFIYFKESEIIGLDRHLVEMLDNAREYAGIPFIITSGLRTPEHSESVGGSKSDAHTRGLAVDLRCADSVSRFLIVGSLLQAGFVRIGVKSNHVHADIDHTLDQKVFWIEKE